MPDWNAVGTVFLESIAAALPILFAGYILLILALAHIRQLIAETLGSEVVQAIAGAAALANGKPGAAPGGVKAIVASKGMDIVGRLLGMG